jgi:hypothetical protein
MLRKDWYLARPASVSLNEAAGGARGRERQ